MSAPTARSSWTTRSTSVTGRLGCAAQEYDAVVEAFVDAVERVFPRAILQWEDFKQHNALRVLDRYRHRLPCFNDDIQGTGAVVLAGLLAARRERGGLTSDRFMFLGAGGAAIGIATLLQRELVAEGMDPRAAAAAIVMLDSHGLVHRIARCSPTINGPSRTHRGDSEAGLRPSEFADPVAIARATGTDGPHRRDSISGVFPEALVREVALHDNVPSSCRCRTRARVPRPGPRTPGLDRRPGTGRGRRAVSRRRRSWRDEGHRSGEQRLRLPGIGLGAIVAAAREVTDEMFLVAAHQLAGLVSADRLRRGALYPLVAGLEPSRGQSRSPSPARPGRPAWAGSLDPEIEAAVDPAMWWPDYVPLEQGHRAIRQ